MFKPIHTLGDEPGNPHTRKCYKCGSYSKPTPSKVRKIAFVCRPCENARSREYLKRKKSIPDNAALKLRNSKQAIASKLRRQRPEVKAMNAARARALRADAGRVEKDNIRRKTRHAIERGTLLKEPCFVCGSEKSNAHHSDYSSPLSVTWLCVPHHNQLHREHLEAINANA